MMRRVTKKKKTHSRRELVLKKEKQLKKLTDHYDLSKPVTLILMKVFKWNENEMLMKLYEHNPVEFITSLHIEQEMKTKPVSLCSICFEEKELLGMSCSHFACIECWEKLMETKINDGERFYKCPFSKCEKIVNQESIIKSIQIDKQVLEKYENQQINSMIQDDPSFKFCPGPKCQKIIEKENGNSDQCDDCGTYFCNICLEEAHDSITCEEMKYIKNHYKIERTKLRTRIKKCPKCGEGIEKNGGCDHMTCKCSHSFSWKNETFNEELKPTGLDFELQTQIQIQKDEKELLEVFSEIIQNQSIVNILLKARIVLKWSYCSTKQKVKTFIYNRKELTEKMNECFKLLDDHSKIDKIKKETFVIEKLIENCLEDMQMDGDKGTFVYDKIAYSALLNFSEEHINDVLDEKIIKFSLEASNNDIQKAQNIILDWSSQV
eukprot:gene1984-1492_t